jgi:hypothetical protein
MYQMVRATGLFPSISLELPTCLAALIIAELFYKFHSFTLECVAFLATLFTISWLVDKFADFFKRKRG